jgi:protein SCO1/2
MIGKFLRTVLLASILFTVCFGSRARAEEQRYKRSIENYAMPDVVLVNQNGKKVRFKELMQSRKPVIVDFIYGTCTTICPILSVSFANLQQKLGSNSLKVQLVSISIDPENDTPKVMSEYLKRYRSKPGWDFLTGSRKDIDKVMYAFNAYIPNKMSHFPLTLIRSPGDDGKWIRIYGLMGSSEFTHECQKVGIL